MQKETLNIPNISCGHCVMAIEKELKTIPGVTAVVGNPDTKQVAVEWDSPASMDAIKKPFRISIILQPDCLQLKVFNKMADTVCTI